MASAACSAALKPLAWFDALTVALAEQTITSSKEDEIEQAQR
jgi:hypothetical protein